MYCDYCNYEPNLNDAFEKYGLLDGDACGVEDTNIVTCDIRERLERIGYTIETVDYMGHNPECIDCIKRGDEVVYPIEGFQIGGFDARPFQAVLPQDILRALEDSPYNWL